MLYPKEDRENSTLMFACRTCQFSEPAGASCIYRNSLKETIAETPGNVQDVAQDPTVGASPAQQQHAQQQQRRLRQGALQTPPYEDDEIEDDDDDDDKYYVSDTDKYDDMAMDVDEYNEFDMVADLCTLCGQQILCPHCGRPTDSGILLEAEDPELEAKRRGEDAVQLELRERALSGAGSANPE